MTIDTKQLIENLSDNLQPVGGTACPYKLFTKGFGLTLLYIILMLVIVGVRDDIAVKFASPLFIAEVFALAVTIGSGLLATFFLSFPDICQKKCVLFYPVLSLLLLMVVIAIEYTSGGVDNVTIEHNIECTLAIGMLSFLPAILIFRTIRKHATTYCCTAGFVTLLTSASIGTIILRFSEKVDSITHIIAWHYLPLISFAVIGIIIGKKILRW